jgi:hypothetical protein
MARAAIIRSARRRNSIAEQMHTKLFKTASPSVAKMTSSSPASKLGNTFSKLNMVRMDRMDRMEAD